MIWSACAPTGWESTVRGGSIMLRNIIRIDGRNMMGWMRWTPTMFGLPTCHGTWTMAWAVSSSRVGRVGEGVHRVYLWAMMVVPRYIVWTLKAYLWHTVSKFRKSYPMHSQEWLLQSFLRTGCMVLHVGRTSPPHPNIHMYTGHGNDRSNPFDPNPFFAYSSNINIANRQSRKHLLPSQLGSKFVNFDRKVAYLLLLFI